MECPCVSCRLRKGPLELKLPLVGVRPCPLDPPGAANLCPGCAPARASTGGDPRPTSHINRHYLQPRTLAKRQGFMTSYRHLVGRENHHFDQMAQYCCFGSASWSAAASSSISSWTFSLTFWMSAPLAASVRAASRRLFSVKFLGSP